MYTATVAIEFRAEDAAHATDIASDIERWIDDCEPVVYSVTQSVEPGGDDEEEG